MKKAIVTGATGAVGTALVNKLISEGVETCPCSQGRQG